MQSDAQSSELKVRNRVQAVALESPLRTRLLMACVARERSLTDLQRLTGQTLPKLHYHVARLLDAGLLQVSRRQTRGGRPIRLFRAVAERFVVPEDFLGDPPGEALAAELRTLLQRSRGAVSLSYSADANGNPLVRLVREENDRPLQAIELWKVLRLSRAQRDALARELVDLFARYTQAEVTTGGEAIVIHAAFAPRPSGG